MESVPVLQPSPRDVAPRRAVTALRLRNARKRKGLVPLPRSRLPVTRVRARAGLVANARDEGGGGRTISSEILQIPLSAPVSPSHFPIYRFLFLTRHVSCKTRRTHVGALNHLGGFGPEGEHASNAGFQKSLPGCHQRAHPSAGDHHLGLRLVQLQKIRWMGCYNDDQKKKRVLARWREEIGFVAVVPGCLMICFERFLHACGIRKSTQSTEDNGSGVLSIWPHQRRHRLPHADTSFFFVFPKPRRNSCGGWAAPCCYITAVVWVIWRRLVSSRGRQAKTRTLFRALFRQVVGFRLSPLSSNGIALPIAVTGATHQ